MVPRTLVNAFSSNGWLFSAMVNTANPVQNVQSVPVGSVTANTLKQVLSITGPGVLEQLHYLNNNVNSRTIRLRLVLDGVVVLDGTSALIGSAGLAMLVAGGFNNIQNPPGVQPDEIPFKVSCVLWYASSVTEATPGTVLWSARGI
jgi:hypothetical protein